MRQEKVPALFADTPDSGRHFVRILWSGFYFALTFILINYLDHAITAFSGSLFGFNSFFSYEGVNPFNSNPELWSLKRIAFIFLSAPFLGLLGCVTLLILLYKSYSSSSLSLFLFWLCINSFALFYSYFLSGILGAGHYRSIYYTGPTVFFTWLGLSASVIIFINLFFLLLFSFAAFIFVRLVFKYSYSNLLLKSRSGRIVVLINILLLPFLTGSLIIFLITYPCGFAYQIIRLASICILIFMMFVKSRSEKKSQYAFVQQGGIKHFPFWVLLLCLAFFALFVKFILLQILSF